MEEIASVHSRNIISDCQQGNIVNLKNLDENAKTTLVAGVKNDDDKWRLGVKDRVIVVGLVCKSFDIDSIRNKGQVQNLSYKRRKLENEIKVKDHVGEASNGVRVGDKDCEQVSETKKKEASVGDDNGVKVRRMGRPKGSKNQKKKVRNIWQIGKCEGNQSQSMVDENGDGGGEQDQNYANGVLKVGRKGRQMGAKDKKKRKTRSQNRPLDQSEASESRSMVDEHVSAQNENLINSLDRNESGFEVRFFSKKCFKLYRQVEKKSCLPCIYRSTRFLLKSLV